jgi:bis(5'-nucleosyl)-tetraphosphatase (symmetrical)
MHWLLNQNLLITKKKYHAVIVHAGIYPKWTIKRAKKEAKKVETLLTTKTITLLKNMYGSKPNHWHKQLSGIDRARFTINSLTRMRFLYKNGGLNFKAKGEIETFPKLIPWFNFKPRNIYKKTVIFGHWSALGLYQKNNTICLDTGKVWGGKLTALKLSKTKLTIKNTFQV